MVGAELAKLEPAKLRLNPLLSWPEDVVTIRGDHDFHRVFFFYDNFMETGLPIRRCKVAAAATLSVVTIDLDI
ncbi:hypothetical protein TIFTF001_033752 [Ficus carica]|uniref:Uncharacterized protein n=1 Tax=Ficus carica TaxID=3494 RepID=A0AA88J808_FICCA|nr:hypothetical protein TIFTF001_033752 [Ficus carica]